MNWVGALKTEMATDEERYALRHSLSLVAQVSSDDIEATPVVVHNVSCTGVLVEADLPLELGDEVTVELPHAEAQRATVVWSSGSFHGCEFDNRISDAAVSAARLRSMPMWRPEANPFDDSVADVVPFLPTTRTAPAGRLTIRRKMFILAGLTATCWAGVGSAGWLLFSLI